LPSNKEVSPGLVIQQDDQARDQPIPLKSVEVRHLADEVGNGLLPIGAIVALASHLTGAFSLPVSGSVSRGLMRCDGAAIPLGQMLSGSTPNLTDSRFLMGSTTSGVTGGNAANQKALSASEMPSHSHSIDHGHSNTLGVSADGGHGHGHSLTAATGGTHGHGFSLSANNTDLSHTHSGSTSTNPVPANRDAGGSAGTPTSTNSGIWTLTGASFINIIDIANSNHSHSFTTGGASASMNHGHSISGSVGGADGSHSHSVTGTVGGSDGLHSHALTGGVSNFNGSSGSAGSGSAFDIRPLYLSTIFLLRVS
jgi:hypothetical protein